MTTISSQDSLNIENPSNEEAIDKILENLPTEIETSIEVPSRGKFYNLKDPSSPLTVRPMTFEDEKVIASTKNKDQLINILIDRCVANININELLIFDKLYLLLKIREVSFGKNYTVEDICTNCGFHNEITFDIADFKLNEVPEDLTDPREVTLPSLKKTAMVRFPRVSDEAHLQKVDEVIDQIWRFVEEIDGNSNKTVIHKVIQKLPSKDVHILIKSIFGTEYGIKTKATYSCDNCENVNIADLSLTQDFFSAS
jgi:hypothetical protein